MALLRGLIHADLRSGLRSAWDRIGEQSSGSDYAIMTGRRYGPYGNPTSRSAICPPTINADDMDFQVVAKILANQLAGWLTGAL